MDMWSPTCPKASCEGLGGLASGLVRPAMMSLMGYGKEEWDSGTESTAEELHEDLRA